MKKLAVVSVLLVFCLSQFLFAEETSRMEQVNWEAFSKNVVQSLSSKNYGVRHAALQNIIKYGEKLDVNDAVLDIVGIYRNSKDQKVRQLAVVALHKIHNDWAMGFLKRNLQFEANPTIKRQILDCIAQHEEDLAAKTNIAKETAIDSEDNQLGASK